MRATRWIVGALLLAAVVLAVKYTRHYFVAKNFYAVEPGLCRGGKQSGRVFSQLLREHHFKTVISLAGEFPEERKAAEAAGARYLVFKWKGSGLGPFDEYQQVAKLLQDPALRPVFYHCFGGEKRTNAATFAYLIETGLPPETAFARLEPYGFSKADDTQLYAHLQEYVTWRELQRAHTASPATAHK